MPGDTVIELDNAVPDRGVQFGQGKEAPVAKPGDDPTLSQLNTDFRLRFIAWFVRTGRHNGRIVMRSEIGIGAIDRRFVEARLGDAGFEIVRDDLRRDTAEETKGALVGTTPVRQRLCQGCLGISIAGGSQHGDKQLAGVHFAGSSVNELNRLTGIIDEHALTGRMRLTHGGRQAAFPLSVAIAELTVAVTIRMDGAVLLPQQHQRDGPFAQLAVEICPVRLRTRFPASLVRCSKQALLQRCIVQIVRHRPAETGTLRALQIVADRGATYAKADRNLTVGQAGGFEPQCFSYFAHR